MSTIENFTMRPDAFGEHIANVEMNKKMFNVYTYEEQVGVVHEGMVVVCFPYHIVRNDPQSAVHVALMVQENIVKAFEMGTRYGVTNHVLLSQAGDT